MESNRRNPQNHIDFSELPPSITYLSLKSTYRMISAMPTSIKYLHLYQSNYMHCLRFIQSKHLSKLKQWYILHYKTRLDDYIKQLVIPRTNDILDIISISGSIFADFDLAPRTAKTLIIDYRLGYPTFIPPNITNIIIQEYNKSCHIRRLKHQKKNQLNLIYSESRLMSQQHNIFEDLPFLILRAIVNRINDNIDRVCFSLVCKRWFDNRDKYLLFNANTLKTIPTLRDDSECNTKSNVLGSYQSIYSNSLEFKDNATMIILDNHTQFFTDYYDFVYDHYILSQYGIPSNVRSLFISTRVDLRDDALLSSNITNIIGYKSFKLKLPPTTKILHVGSTIREILTKDCFPSGLEQLNLKFLRNQITKGMLPDGLKSIHFELEQDQPIEPGVLPSSLLKLTLINAKPNQLIKMGVLPPNLEYLRINGNKPPNISESYLPQTLQTLESIPSSWIPLIKSLPNLTTLVLENPDPIKENVLNLSDLPPTLTSLSFNSEYHLTSALSPTIKYLYLHRIHNNNGVQLYDFKEIFPETIQYHLIELTAFSLPESVLPNLKIDKFIHANESLFSDLPLLNVDHMEVKVIQRIEQSIIKSTMNLPTLPYGTKYLQISLEELVQNPLTIPTSVETLEIVQATQTLKKLAIYVIPDFVRTLIIDFSFEYPLYIPPTLTNITFKYLSVGKDKYNENQSQYKSNVLGSYQSIYLNSLEFKDNATMIIIDNKTQYFTDYYDFVYDHYSLSRYSIPSNVSFVFLSTRIDLRDDALLSSNITKILGPNNFKLKLPPTTKFLNIGCTTSENLTKNYFPSGLEDLKMRIPLEYHLTKGILPDGLKSLHIGFKQDQPIEPGVLPSSLKKLTLILAKPNQLAKTGVLPPNLEFLQINCDPPPHISESYLPQTLQTLEFVPSTWVPLIKSLPNLTTLSLENQDPDQNVDVLNLSDLPPTLTSLSFKSRYHLKLALSPTIKYLYLYTFQIDIGVQLYDFKEMFPETIQYHLIELKAISLPESVLPNLKIDKFIHANESLFSDLAFLNNDRLEVKVTKEGTEQSIFKCSLNLQTLPYGIKYLQISLEELFKNRVTIPTSVETLEIVQIAVTGTKLPVYGIPDFVRTLIIECSFEYPLYIPPTITNITFKYLSFGKDKCQVRKLDSNYYLLFGWPNKDNYHDKRITKIIHKSNFNHYFRKSQLFIE
ncbi:hypothetical protein PPL_02610 [Heterostelium album PN500]|uniref:Uncharacterized protein n=1 Tax=Heterostelium pallidum (strain ATCC 26659 / Pp 5 / PN500) TaxID=670386 RepID=D3B2J7_HETP5|nr:hypothetical protein PPL_02610 [Heterostelium album PN500]EFA83545.1 hypothetical protein PPL_02610 [Heterostelium album PN500]|eukprot:XP_020435662.1 hypothetical protein PPL_02610 [Heterostelium album PN500]